jgi:hypothetical protein
MQLGTCRLRDLVLPIRSIGQLGDSIMASALFDSIKQWLARRCYIGRERAASAGRPELVVVDERGTGTILDARRLADHATRARAEVGSMTKNVRHRVVGSLEGKQCAPCREGQCDIAQAGRTEAEQLIQLNT